MPIPPSQTTESLKTDNTKLYEKVRYLQNFSNTGKSSYARGRNDRDLDLEALEQRYEASVDPFRQFSRAERQRKYNEMSAMERIVFIGSKTMLANKQMRTVLFFYVMAMHLLVFGTTLNWSHSSNCDFIHQHESLAHFHGGVSIVLQFFFNSKISINFLAINVTRFHCQKRKMGLNVANTAAAIESAQTR